MTTLPEKKWFAYYTKSRNEKKVLELLTVHGIEAYLPLRKEQHQWSDRKKWVEVPLISSYIFVRIVLKEVKTILTFNGVVAYVTSYGKVATIPDAEIELMRRTVENDLILDVQQGLVAVGQTIRIKSGPLAGIEGIVNEVKGERKCYLSISGIGYTLIVDLKESKVEPTDA